VEAAERKEEELRGLLRLEAVETQVQYLQQHLTGRRGQIILAVVVAAHL
jgi:hypothetical protein